MTRTTILTVAAVLATALTGCEQFTMSGERPTPTAQSEPAVKRSAVRPEPVAASDPQDARIADDAVDKALAYAEKYMTEADENKKLRGQIRQLETRIQALSKDKQTLGGQLAAARDELDQANAMVMELSSDLKKWKRDVLGFRQQMIGAQEAQIKGINMILKIMGFQSEKATASVPIDRRPEPTTKPAAS